MDAPFVSIVVPTRNRASLLRACLTTLSEQDYPDELYEIVVVDNGSNDSTASIVESVSQMRLAPKIQFKVEPRRGANSARNLGIRVAKGGLICLVDDDVVAPRGWLAAVVRGSVRHPNAGALGGPIRLQTDGKPPRLCGRESLGETELDLGMEEKPVKHVWSANMAVTRQGMSVAGWFNEDIHMGEEEEWEERLVRRGGEIIYLPDAGLWHRRTARDLSVLRLTKTRFLRGWHRSCYLRVVGRSVGASKQFWAIPRLFGHAARRRCVWGFLAGTEQLGLICGSLMSAARGRAEQEIQ